jgi:type VI secretion system protein ImpD
MHAFDAQTSSPVGGHQTDAPGETAAAIAAALRRLCDDPADLRLLLGRMILGIDACLAAQLNLLLEHQRFKALEAAWRGTELVVAASAGSADIRIKMFDQTWSELSRDLQSGLDSRRSVSYRNIVMRELDTPGGEPFGVLFVDHGLSLSIDNEYDDFHTAQLLCDLGAAAACPVILGLAPDFFGENDAAWVTNHRRIASILTGDDYRSWHMLRHHANARFLGIAWPEVLLRGRYEDCDAGFAFHQWPSSGSGVWGQGGIAFLCTIIAEYRRCAWFGFLKMVGNGAGEGAVVSLAWTPTPAGSSRVAVARLRLTRSTGQFLSEQGLIPLCESLKSHDLYFVGNRSVTACEGATACEVLTQIQSVLIACRMVHYLKVLIRGLIGQIKSASECEVILNNWLEQYCANVADGSPEILARYPLRSARAQVMQDGLGDGARFICAIDIRPQYQVDNLLGDISFTTDFRSDSRRPG